MPLWTALDLIAKATILLLIVGAMTTAVGKMSAATRHRVWSLAFAGLLVLPIFQQTVPGWNWRIIPSGWNFASLGEQPASLTAPTFDTDFSDSAGFHDSADGGQAQVARKGDGTQQPDAAQVVQTNQPSVEARNIQTTGGTSATPNSQDHFPFTTLMWIGWGIGAICVLLPLAAGAIVNLEYRLRSRKIIDPGLTAILDEVRRQLEVRRKVVLLAGSADQMPMTFGMLRPVVVLPEGAVGWSTERQRLVMFHELAHVKRLDVPIQALARIAGALYWFHPLVWWSIRRMRLDREHACDDCVLLAGEKASTYAAELLEIAREYRVRLTLASAALSMARPSQLEGRLLAVLDAARVRAPISWRRSIWLALTAAAIVVGFGLVRPALHAQTAEDNKSVRVLHFPADRAVGTIYVRPPNDKSFAKSVYDDDWKRVGEAIGDRRVPAVFQVRLDVGEAASEDLSFLRKLGADDVQYLRLGNTQVKDEGLFHLAHLTGLRALDLHQTRITDAAIAPLASLKGLQWINLEAFSVHREGFGVGDGALKVLAALPALEAIDLRLTNVTDVGMAELAKLKTLKSLEIPGTKVSDAGLVHLNRLPNLEILSLGVYDEGVNVTDEGLKQVGKMANLQRLDLSGTKITNEGLEALANLKKLKFISLDNTKATEAGFAHLAPLTALEEVRMYPRDTDVSDVGAEHLSKLKSLKRITCPLELSKKGVAAIATLPQLEDFELFGDKIDDEAVALLEPMKAIKRLSFQNSPITDKSLEHLRAFDKLELLFLHRTKVTGEGFKHLAHLPAFYLLTVDFGSAGDDVLAPEVNLKHLSSLPGLRILRMSGDGLKNEDLKVLRSLPWLEELDLEISVDDVGSEYIGGLAALKMLNLNSSVITDDGLRHFAGLRSLEQVQMSGKFTDVGIQHFAKLKSLAWINVESEHVTDEGMAALAKARPSLQRATHWSRKSNELYVKSPKDGIRRYGELNVLEAHDALEDKLPPPLQLAGWLNTPEKGLTIADLKGKVVVVYFWGVWCGPCRAFTPRLKELNDKYGPKGLVILGIHTTSEAEQMPEYAKKEGLTWPLAADVEKGTVEAWKVQSYPSVYLIDRQGKLRMAGIDRDDLEKAVVKLLDDAAGGEEAIKN